MLIQRDAVDLMMKNIINSILIILLWETREDKQIPGAYSKYGGLGLWKAFTCKNDSHYEKRKQG